LKLFESHEVFKVQDVPHRNLLITLKSNACKDSVKTWHASRLVW